MPEIQVIPSPLLITQARAAHPFFVGAQAMTRRTTNLWPDDRQRLLRRPAVVQTLDSPRQTPVTSLFEYQYRSRSSRPVRLLVGMEEANFAEQFAQVSVLSEHMDQSWDVDGPVVNSRMKLSAVIDVYTPNVKFKFGELIEIYLETINGGASGGSRWIGDDFIAEVWVDNLDYAAEDGELIIRTTDVLVAGTQFRVVGKESGANVRFDSLFKGEGAFNIWVVASNLSPSEQQWRVGSVTTFAQFRNLLFFTDDSFLYPVRVWTGGRQQARYLSQAPKAGLLTTHQSRVWLADLERNGSEIVGSRILDPYSWEPDGSVDGPISLQIEQDDRDAVTGIAQSFRGDLYVWKGRSLHRITGQIIFPQPPAFQPTFQRQTVTRSIGCVSQRTITHVGNDIFWMSEKGIHSLATTEKFGDVETTYLSFSIADVFEEVNYGAVKASQAVYEPRLGLYLIGVPTNGSKHMNLLLAYSQSSNRWMSWDIGEFSSIAIGPPVTMDSTSIYVSLVRPFTHRLSDDIDEAGYIAVLDFGGQTDYSNVIQERELTNISVVIEPGDMFMAEQDPSIRYQKKSVPRLQAYLASPGNFSSDIIYSWDGGEERTAVLDLNPQKSRAFGTGFKLGANEVGNELTSDKDTTVSSVSIKSRGHSLRYRIEDSNPGLLPYLHVDLEVEMHDKDYTAQVRR